MYLLINQRHYVSALSTANSFIFIYVEVTTLQNEVEHRVCRQSDRLFLHSSEWGPPPPLLPAGECTFWFRGGGHTVEGMGCTNSEEGPDIVVL